jgi:hypothetical protein
MDIVRFVPLHIHDPHISPIDECDSIANFELGGIRLFYQQFIAKPYILFGTFGFLGF